MPHDLTDEQLDELAALVTLFDAELSEDVEGMLVTWAAEMHAAHRSGGSTRERSRPMS